MMLDPHSGQKHGTELSSPVSCAGFLDYDSASAAQPASHDLETLMTLVTPPSEKSVLSAAPDVMCPTANTGRWVLAATILGSSMVFIDGTVVNVALPVLQQELRATVADVQWVVEAYALFLAALILVGGSLGDRFGRRRVFTVGVVLFTVASVLCGLAPNIVTLIVARAIQGVGGALLTPGSLAIISATFSADQRGRAIGTWSGFTAITTALGPVLGGWLVQAASWRWVFFINVPLAAVVLAITLTRVPESRDETASRLDWQGALLATLGLGAVVFGLITSSARGLGDPLVVTTVLLGIAILVAFVLVERRAVAPMMPLPLFQSRTFSGTNLLTLLLYAALGATTFFVPFNLIQVQGYPPAGAGAAFLPFILLMFSLSRWSGGLVARYGAKLPLVIGPLIAAAGLALYAVPDIGGSYWLTFFPAVVVLGLGMSITVAPLTTAVMGAVSQQHAGIASGINNAVSRTAGLLAIAVLGIVMLAAFNAALDSHLAALHLTPAVRQALDAQRTQLAAARIPASVTGPERIALQRALAESFIAGFRTVMLVCVGLAIASSACAAVFVEGAGLRLPKLLRSRATHQIGGPA